MLRRPPPVVIDAGICRPKTRPISFPFWANQILARRCRNILIGDQGPPNLLAKCLTSGPISWVTFLWCKSLNSPQRQCNWVKHASWIWTLDTRLSWSVSVTKMLSSPPVVALIGSTFCFGGGYFILLNQAPTYLHNVQHICLTAVRSSTRPVVQQQAFDKTML